MDIRCFDLGGSGLKTCVCRSDDSTLHCLFNAGASEHDDIARWVRERLPTFEQEIAEGFAFSFSLAGLDKLSKNGRLPNDRGRRSVAELFQLPEERVSTLNDGDAHLLASQTVFHGRKLPHVNFALGTGIGIGMYDESGHKIPEAELTFMLRRKIWDFEVDCSASKKVASFALAAQGLEELWKSAPEGAVGRFERRWLKFLQVQVLPILHQAPAAITFTGGVADFANLFSESSALGGRIRRGPKYAGLVGARFHAERPE